MADGAAVELIRRGDLLLYRVTLLPGRGRHRGRARPAAGPHPSRPALPFDPNLLTAGAPAVPDDRQLTRVDFIMPVYNEGPNIARALAEIDETGDNLQACLVVYDFDGDSTLPEFAEARPPLPLGLDGQERPGPGRPQRHPRRHRRDRGRGGHHHHGRPLGRPERSCRGWSR